MSFARSTRLLLGLALLFVASCGTIPFSTTPVDERAIAEAYDRMTRGEIEAAVARLESFVSATERDPREFRRERFFAEYLLARAHTVASLDSGDVAFLAESSRTPATVGAIGRRDAAGALVQRPSHAAHVVAAFYHASRARGMYAAATRVGATDDPTLPAELAELDVMGADAQLQLLQTIAYARLGFRDRVDEILARSPDLLTLDSCLATLDRYRFPAELRPWICEMVFHHLKGTDERTAYRFAILAVEGADRFGLALSPAAVAAIDEWIVHEANLLFVCPESQTPYIPGEKRSPISGLPHFEYIAVERPRGN